jgi:DNA polymerase
MSSAKPPKTSAKPPETADLKRLEKASKDCLVCPFAKDSTQTVFGQGPRSAPLMIIGECPGNVEDLKGEPFVGPAGRLLKKILQELGANIERIYFTNAVKHFKFSWRGKIRLHSKPSAAEIHACHPWLLKEITAIRPSVIIALGTTAAFSLLGRHVVLGRERNQWIKPGIDNSNDISILVTWHPSAILRSSSDPGAQKKRQELFSDLKKAIKKAFGA